MHIFIIHHGNIFMVREIFNFLVNNNIIFKLNKRLIIIFLIKNFVHSDTTCEIFI